MEKQNITLADSGQAFDQAIKSGRLSADSSATNYAGLYMYMYTQAGLDMFKHIETRVYLGSRPRQLTLAQRRRFDVLNQETRLNYGPKNGGHNG